MTAHLDWFEPGAPYRWGDMGVAWEVSCHDRLDALQRWLRAWVVRKDQHLELPPPTHFVIVETVEWTPAPRSNS